MSGPAWEFAETSPGSASWLADIKTKVAAQRQAFQEEYDQAQGQVLCPDCGRKFTSVEAYLLPTLNVGDVRWGFRLEHPYLWCRGFRVIDGPDWLRP